VLLSVCLCALVVLVLLQVQVWDIQQQQDSMRRSMDPILKISEGIEGKVRQTTSSSSSYVAAAICSCSGSSGSCRTFCRGAGSWMSVFAAAQEEAANMCLAALLLCALPFNSPWLWIAELHVWRASFRIVCMACSHVAVLCLHYAHTSCRLSGCLGMPLASCWLQLWPTMC
jgi:hypothetical protein